LALDVVEDEVPSLAAVFAKADLKVAFVNNV